MRKTLQSKVKKNHLTVQVGEPWPDELEVSVDNPSAQSRDRSLILLGTAGVIGLQQIAFTAYGWLFSEEILKNMLGVTQCLSAALIVWAVGPKVGDKIGAIAKALTKNG